MWKRALRWTGEFMKGQLHCKRCTWLSWWRANWARRQSSQYTHSVRTLSREAMDTSSQNQFPQEGEKLGTELLLLSVKTSHLRWFRLGCLFNVSGLEVFLAHPNTKGTHGRNNSLEGSCIPWEYLGNPVEELQKELLGRGMSGIFCLAYCHCESILGKRRLMGG